MNLVCDINVSNVIASHQIFSFKRETEPKHGSRKRKQLC